MLLFVVGSSSDSLLFDLESGDTASTIETLFSNSDTMGSEAVMEMD